MQRSNRLFTLRMPTSTQEFCRRFQKSYLASKCSTLPPGVQEGQVTGEGCWRQSSVTESKHYRLSWYLTQPFPLQSSSRLVILRLSLSQSLFPHWLKNRLEQILRSLPPQNPRFRFLLEDSQPSTDPSRSTANMKIPFSHPTLTPFQPNKKD